MKALILAGTLIRARVLCMAVLLLTAVAANSQTYSVLYNLGTNSGDPLNPAWMGLFAQGRDGNLYSTSQTGGTANFGTVFQLTPAGKVKVLHSFLNQDDGAFPNSGLTLGADGSLYGTTNVGGAIGFGIIFKITTTGNFKILHDFNGNTEGMTPNSPPILGMDGNLYGVTGNGNNAVFGTAYKITPQGTFKLLHTFDTNLRYPVSLIQGVDGNLYGTTLGGGITNFGTVFKMTPQGNVTLLYKFDGAHGQIPNGNLMQGSDGNLYGTTRGGGASGTGAAYKLTLNGVITVLRSFANDGHGLTPFNSVIQATDGKLYGATTTDPGVAFGVLYQLTTTGTYADLIFLSNTTGANPGGNPQVSLFQHTNGKFYGDTVSGGSLAKGVLYSLDMGLGKFATLVPWWGKVGASVGILGQGFTGTTKVTFNGVNATFSVVSDTYLTATVPAGAANGFVMIKTPGGTLKSSRKIYVRPVILSFDPTSGPEGTAVTITGTSFTGARLVTFGGVKATTFTVDSDTQITATVPVGAKTGKIVVAAPGGNATSSTDFTVTE